MQNLLMNINILMEKNIDMRLTRAFALMWLDDKVSDELFIFTEHNN